MTIERFSKQQFEDALSLIHPGFEPLGINASEECYAIPVNNHTRLKIRSSVDKSGYAADTGEDSIRLWLEVYQPDWRSNRGDRMIWNSVSRKVDAYTTRVAGWEQRLENKVRILWERAVKIRQAPTCCNCNDKHGASVNISNSAKNPGRPFQSCRKCNFFEWLDKEPVGKVEFEVSTEEVKEPYYKDFNKETFEVEDTTPIFDFENFDINKDVFKPSPYQQAVFDFVKDGSGHGICNAVAGSGKTTTVIEALRYVPESLNTVFLAFNRHIASELLSRGVDCASTFHSLGKQNITQSMPTAKFNQYKVFNTCDEIETGISYDEKSQYAKIIGLLKGNLLDCTKENIEAIIDDFPSIGRIDEDDKGKVIRMVMRIWETNEANSTEYDFDDMIYWPATGKVKCQQFDFIFVDECQDLNKAQIEMAERSMAAGGRMLLIGDPWQSIYAFRGAFVGIMEYMAYKLQATQLPLSISYRAPIAIVEMVNRMFPEIDFQASDNAINGKVESISQERFLEQVQPGDGIICRTNAPLVAPCFNLIRQGIKATILGRDIGKGLISLVNKRSKLQRVKNLPVSEQLAATIEELDVYFRNEKKKLEKAEKHGVIQNLQDQIETIIAISDGCVTIKELTDKIKSTFSDKVEGIVFSSVHKAKGLEWEKVYILRPDLLPHPMAKTDRDKEQESHISYVARTRTKNELYLVLGK